MDKNIKDYREKELSAYVAGNILIILLGTGLFDQIVSGTAISLDIVIDLLKALLFSSIIYIFVFILDSVVPSKLKKEFIWMITDEPGKKIFTNILDGRTNDSRFSKDDVIVEYADIYNQIDEITTWDEKKEYQNNCWYRIYKRWENEAAIYIAQRDFLLCRDMCVMTIWIIAGFLLLEWYLGQCVSWKTCIILVIELVVTFFAARSKGRRCSCNVIATDLSKNKEV